MATCIHHPEVPTSRRCQLCRQPYCGACLEAYPHLGAVCSSCEGVLRGTPLEGLDAPTRTRTLEALSREVRTSLPRPPRSPWVELLYWTGVLIPIALVGLLTLQTLQLNRFLAFLSQEPRLPAVTTARLMAVATRLEEVHTRTGHYPPNLQALSQSPDDASLRDPYAPTDLLRYALDGEEFRLCSIGPDRQFSQGAPLDRITAAGDLCVGGIKG